MQDENPFDQETDLEDAINAFMTSEPDDDDLSDDEEDEPTTEADEEEAEADEEDEDAEEDEEESEDDPEDSEDDDEDKEPSEAKTADEDAEVTVTVDGKEHRVSVKELKRLYGQEASLTQKSQAIAAQRRIVEAQGMFTAQVLQQRYDKAKAEAEKYKDVDLFRASRELDPDEFDALRSAKENAESEFTALEREGREFLQKSQQMRGQMLREQAQQAIKEITKAIPDWNDELYGQIRTYAVSQGMEPELVNDIVDPTAIVMMHKAMKFDQVQSAKGKVTKKVSKAPKKAVSKGDRATDNTTSKLKAKRRTAHESGDIDDVAEAFLAAMNDE